MHPASLSTFSKTMCQNWKKKNAKKLSSFICKKTAQMLTKATLQVGRVRYSLTQIFIKYVLKLKLRLEICQVLANVGKKAQNPTIFGHVPELKK